MTRKSKQEKIINIDVQIKELEEKKKQMQDDLYKLIGKNVINIWGCSDDKKLLSAIDKLKDEAKSIISEYDKTDIQSDNQEI